MLFEQPPDLALAVDRDAVFPQHAYVAPVLVGGLVYVKVVLKQAGSRMNDAVEKFLAGSVHQYQFRRIPFGFG